MIFATTSLGPRMTDVSRENVSKFFDLAEGNKALMRELSDADAETVVLVAARHELEFDEADLRSALKESIYAARSLPYGFGWPLARRMGLVRS
jgi:hypothetical protein